MQDYQAVRALTDVLAAPLSAEDQTVQSMPDVSPTKWHRAHTSWFFETFLLETTLPGYRCFHPRYAYLFNSYYESLGPRPARAERGQLSRPGIEEISAYRQHVDRHMLDLCGSLSEHSAELVSLGLHHEQQHQELLLMDIKHVLSVNPLAPVYRPRSVAADPDQIEPRPIRWIEQTGGIREIGHGGPGFAFDNETPRHAVLLQPFALADRPVTCGEWLAFMDDGGYRRPEFWLAEGWAAVQNSEWAAPLYWSEESGSWQLFTLGGPRALDQAEPVCHISYYEADAFARWSGGRLPTEAEWETTAVARPDTEARHLDLEVLHPRPAGPDPTWSGDVWQWTASPYVPYPGFRPARGAVGEYNGKFMVNQYVLRGGSCVTPPGHHRRTYRNFFPAGARWAFSGLRLARDLT